MSFEYTMLLGTRHSAFLQAQCYLRPSKKFNRQHQSLSSRILSSLAVLEQRDGKLQNASLSAVTAAQKLGGSITGFIAGSRVRSVAEEAAKVKGVEKIIMVENGVYDKVRFLYHTLLRSYMIATNIFRLSLRITLLYLLKTLREKSIHMYSLDTRLLART